MRKVVLCLACLSVLTLSTSAAFAQKKEPAKDLPAAAADCTMQPGNIVANCQFQSGAFAPWVNTGDTSASSVLACGHIAGTNCAFMGPVFYLGQLRRC